jgi:hypothetical protein
MIPEDDFINLQQNLKQITEVQLVTELLEGKISTNRI